MIKYKNEIDGRWKSKMGVDLISLVANKSQSCGLMGQ